jgi:putative hydrolase of the HAD superfamily
MTKKVLLLDLDNTIYPVSSIAVELFSKLFKHIENNPEYTGDPERIKQEIQRIPFQKVIPKFSFSPKLAHECNEMLRNLTYDKPMNPFEDYRIIKKLPIKKYLVTSGYTKLQESKVDQLKIRQDFEAIYILDMEKSQYSKKDIFVQILSEESISASEAVVIGDDLDSEIKAGKDLGIDSLLYDRCGKQKHNSKVISIRNFYELADWLLKYKT